MAKKIVWHAHVPKHSILLRQGKKKYAQNFYGNYLTSATWATKIEIHGVIIFNGWNYRGYKFQK